jgi:hypothetical protein
VSDQITPNHLEFLELAKNAFQENSIWETYRNPHYPYIALRMGMDRDCVLVYELGDFVTNFVQQMEPAPGPRKVVSQFAYDMEKQLKANDHKIGWEREHHQDLTGFMSRQWEQLRKELIKIDRDKYKVTQLCANIANYAMMVADNEGQNL